MNKGFSGIPTKAVVIAIAAGLAMMPVKASAVCEQQAGCTNAFSNILSKTKTLDSMLAELINQVKDGLEKVIVTTTKLAEAEENEQKALDDNNTANDATLLKAERMAEAIDDHRATLQQCIELSSAAAGQEADAMADALEEAANRLAGGRRRFGSRLSGSMRATTEALQNAKDFASAEEYPGVGTQTDPKAIDKHIKFPTELTLKTEFDQKAAQRFGMLLNGENNQNRAPAPVGEMLQVPGGQLALDTYYTEEARRSLLAIPYARYVSARTVPLTPSYDNSKEINDLLKRMYPDPRNPPPQLSGGVSSAEMNAAISELKIRDMMVLSGIGDVELQRLANIRSAYALKNLWEQKENASLGNMLKGVMIAMTIEEERAKTGDRSLVSRVPVGGR